MINIQTYPLGQLSTNCFIISDPKTKESIIIDPADDGQFIIQKVIDTQTNPIAVIATHGHFDHNLASLEVKMTLKLPYLIHKKDDFLLRKMQSNAKHWLGIEVDPPAHPDQFLTTQQLSNHLSIKSKHLNLKIIETPGHTPGSICLYSPSTDTMFTGDTLFSQGSVGRSDFSYSSEPKLHNSIQKIFSYPKKTTIYPGHGSSSTLNIEKQIHKI